jgi:hypothetical protein
MQYVYNREALLAHAREQANKLKEANPLMGGLKERFGLEIDPDGHYETWKLEGGAILERTNPKPKTLTNDELIERHEAAQNIIKEVRRKRGKARGNTAVVE